jgi:carbamoyltransferase
MTYVLGINGYHGDSAACLVADGKVIAAAEEERFRRIKHWAGFPSESIRYCLAEAGIALDAVDHVAINSNPKANLLKKIRFAFANKPGLSFILDRVKSSKERASLEDDLKTAFPGEPFRGEVHYIEHHLAHLASAFCVSPFDDAVAVSVDGFGDFASAAWGMGSASGLKIDGEIYFPHSLGIFYMAMTQYLGFPHWGDEYKVMGLAPYGSPTHLDKMREIVLLHDDGSYELNMKFFCHHQEKLQEWPGSAPHVNRIFTAALEDLLGPTRESSAELTQYHKDIARSIQAMYEEAFFNLLNAVHRKYGVDRLALAGGCAMNSVANGKVYQRTPFKQLYVQSAAGDAGGAIGAAFIVSQAQQTPAERRNGAKFVMDHAYWGPEFASADLRSVIAQRQSEFAGAGCVVEEIADETELCTRTAQALADGRVVGWFQGRMEWGPRALGNRSILGDPRRADMKELLNLKIKRRESFRPFAPSILRDHVPDWFETDDDVPFMMQVYQIREEKRAAVPAVAHVDGSGRLQTVTREANSRYYELIDRFNSMTGVPMVLNTSFNENEPVVCSPVEALDCFLRTRMDVLVLGDFMVSRNGAAD